MCGGAGTFSVAAAGVATRKRADPFAESAALKRVRRTLMICQEAARSRAGAVVWDAGTARCWRIRLRKALLPGISRSRRRALKCQRRDQTQRSGAGGRQRPPKRRSPATSAVGSSATAGLLITRDAADAMDAASLERRAAFVRSLRRMVVRVVQGAQMRQEGARAQG